MARGNLHARKKVIEEAFVIGIRLLLQGTCELVAVSLTLSLFSKELYLYSLLSPVPTAVPLGVNVGPVRP